MLEIGGYQVIDELGRGGMGLVYRALDPGTQRTVAIKVLHNLDSELVRKRFVREAKALARIRHPQVVRLYHYGETAQGEPFIVMEFVEGHSLQQPLDQDGPLGVDEALATTLQLCGAVAACHQAGVLHRDIKPDNVLVDRAGQVILTDFGIARDIDPEESRTALTRRGRFLGSPGYWSPEQARGHTDAIGEHTDVYGLGGLLYALLTASPPHAGGSLPELLQSLVEPVTPPSRANPAVPRWLDEIVLAALAPQPEDRFATVAELSEALRSRQGTGSKTPSGSLLLGLGFVAGGLVVATVMLAFSPATGESAREEAPSPMAQRSPEPPARPEPPSPASRPSSEPPPRTEPPSPAQPSPTPTGTPNARALYHRGYQFGNAGRHAEAIEVLTESVEADPSYVPTWSTRGFAHYQLGHYAEAEADFTAALDLDPSFTPSWYGRGCARLALGRRTEGKQDLSEVLKVGPGSSWADQAAEVLRELDDQPR